VRTFRYHRGISTAVGRGIDETPQGRLEPIVESIDPLNISQKEEQIWRGLHVLNPKGDDAQVALVGQLQLTRDLPAAPAIAGQDEDKGMAALDALHDAGGPLLARRNIARRDPTGNILALQGRADTIGRCLVFVPVTDKYISCHDYILFRV
jgi:hypothetical protein